VNEVPDFTGSALSNPSKKKPAGPARCGFSCGRLMLL